MQDEEWSYESIITFKRLVHAVVTIIYENNVCSWFQREPRTLPCISCRLHEILCQLVAQPVLVAHSSIVAALSARQYIKFVCDPSGVTVILVMLTLRCG